VKQQAGEAAGWQNIKLVKQKVGKAAYG